MRKSLIVCMMWMSIVALAGSARAGFVPTLVLQAENFSAAPGTSGTFLVTLTNTGPDDVTLSAYQIQMSTDLAGLVFTGVSAASSPFSYVFPGTAGPISSDFGPPYPSPPVTTFTAVDLSAALDGFDIIAAGESYGVLLVSYNLSPSTSSGGGTVYFVSPGTGDTDLTQLSDGDGNLLPFLALGGVVSVVPEPAGSTLLAMGLAVLAVGRCLIGRLRPPTSAA